MSSTPARPSGKQPSPILELLRCYEWWLVGSAAVITTALGVWGFLEKDHSPLDSLYLAIQLFVLQSGFVEDGTPLPLEVARWLAPVVVAYASVKAVWIFGQDQIRAMRLRRCRNHVVVCGLGQKGMQLTNGLLDRGQAVVVVEPFEGNDNIPTCRERGAMVLTGVGSDAFMLDTARTAQARAIIAITGRDDTNVEIAVRAHELLAKQAGRRDKPLLCLVHIFNPRLRELFKRHRLFTDKHDKFDARIFNIYENSARILLNDFAPDRFAPAGHPVHILIAGFGWTGESIAVQAARVCHYAHGEKLKITVIDTNPVREQRFRALYPFINDIVEIRFEAANAEFLNGDVLKRLAGGVPFAAVYVCFGDEALAVQTADRLRKVLGNAEAPILVPMPQRTGTSALLEEGDVLSAEENTHVLNMIERGCDLATVLDETREEIAAAIHHYYAHPQDVESVFPIRDVFAEWDELDQDTRDSNRHQADHIDVKLRAIGCLRVAKGTVQTPYALTEADVQLLAEMEHNRWCAERLLAGWKFGTPRDDRHKIHDALVPWPALSDENKRKCADSVRAIPAQLARVGSEIARQADLPPAGTRSAAEEALQPA